MYTKETFDAHLEQEHRQSVYANNISEIVYGGNDGIVTTFAAIAGFSGAALGNATLTYSVLTVLLFGLANLFADGAAMGLGSFISLRSEKKVYANLKEKERYEILNSPDMERSETKYLLLKKGYSLEEAEELTRLLSKNTEFWVEFMMHYELELPNPEHDNPIIKGLITFLSFCIFGFIPIIPYLLIKNLDNAFFVSAGAASLALIVLGCTRAIVTKESLVRAITETLLVGGTSGTIAFVVGLFFR